MELTKKLILAISLVAIFGLVACGDSKALKLDGGASRLLATVGEFEITNADIQAEFDATVEQQLESAKQGGYTPTEDELDSFKDQVISGIIGQRLFAEQVNILAAQKGWVLDPAENDEQQLFELFQQGVDSMDEYYVQMAEANNMTAEEIKERHETGLYIGSFFLAQAKQKDIILPTDEEIKGFYDSKKGQYFSKAASADLLVIVVNYLQEMVEGVEGVSYDEAVVRIDEVLAELADGADFTKLAKEYSDLYTKEEKAEYKNFSVNNNLGLSSSAVESILAIEEGKTSEMVEGDGFVALVKVNKVKEAQELTIDKVMNFLTNVLIQQKQENGIIFQGIQEEILAVESVNLYSEDKAKAAAEAATAAAEAAAIEAAEAQEAFEETVEETVEVEEAVEAETHATESAE